MLRWDIRINSFHLQRGCRPYPRYQSAPLRQNMGLKNRATDSACGLLVHFRSRRARPLHLNTRFQRYKAKQCCWSIGTFFQRYPIEKVRANFGIKNNFFYALETEHNVLATKVSLSNAADILHNLHLVIPTGCHAMNDATRQYLTNFFRVSTIDVRLKRWVCTVFFAMRLCISTCHLCFRTSGNSGSAAEAFPLYLNTLVRAWIFCRLLFIKKRWGNRANEGACLRRNRTTHADFQ